MSKSELLANGLGRILSNWVCMVVKFFNISGIWLSGGESDEHRRSPDEGGINKDTQTIKSRGEEDLDLDFDLGGETVREVDIGDLRVTGVSTLEG